MNAVLKEIEEAFCDEDLSSSRQDGLRVVITGCRSVLEDLQTQLQKYESMGTKATRTRDRIGWATVDIATCRQRLTTNTSLLSAYLRSVETSPYNSSANERCSSSQIMVERRLKRYIKELQLGLREGSVITSQSSEIATAEEEENDVVWQQIRKEVEDVGITPDDFNANKDFIVGWIRKAIQDGMFKELSVGRRSRIVNSISASTDLDMNHLKIGDPIIVTAVASQETLSRPQSVLDMEENILVASPSALRVPQSRRTQMPIQSNLTIKPQARLLSRRARFMNKVASPLVNYDKDLVDAATNNRVDQVRALLRHADPTIPYKGSTAVQQAIEHSSTGVLQIFLESGVHIDHEVRLDETALIVATQSGKIDVVKILLDYGANVNLPSRRYVTALLAAAENSRDDIVRLLLARGARADLSGRVGQTALHIAASRNDLRSTTLLLESEANVNLADDCGRTALMLAASEGHTKLCALLLARGADVYLRDNHGLAALIHAARNGDIETCSEFLKSQPELSQDRGFGVHPAEMYQLDRALILTARVSKPKKHVHNWRRDLANLLLTHGANINYGRGKQNTALHEAACHNTLSLIELFLTKGADINAVNHKKQTPLHLAAQNGQTSTLYVLIQKGADLAAVDQDEKTTLHYAVLSKKPDTVRALMGLAEGSGLKTEAQDKKCETALALARAKGAHPNILRILQGRPWVEDDTGI